MGSNEDEADIDDILDMLSDMEDEEEAGGGGGGGGGGGAGAGAGDDDGQEAGDDDEQEVDDILGMFDDDALASSSSAAASSAVSVVLIEDADGDGDVDIDDILDVLDDVAAEPEAEPESTDGEQEGDVVGTDNGAASPELMLDGELASMLDAIGAGESGPLVPPVLDSSSSVDVALDIDALLAESLRGAVDAPSSTTDSTDELEQTLRAFESGRVANHDLETDSDAALHGVVGETLEHEMADASFAAFLDAQIEELGESGNVETPVILTVAASADIASPERDPFAILAELDPSDASLTTLSETLTSADASRGSADFEVSDEHSSCSTCHTRADALLSEMFPSTDTALQESGELAGAGESSGDWVEDGEGLFEGEGEVEYVEEVVYVDEDGDVVDAEGVDEGEVEYVEEVVYVDEDGDVVDAEGMDEGEVEYVDEVVYVDEDGDVVDAEGVDEGEVEYVEEVVYVDEDGDVVDAEGMDEGEVEYVDEVVYVDEDGDAVEQEPEPETRLEPTPKSSPELELEPEPESKPIPTISFSTDDVAQLLAEPSVESDDMVSGSNEECSELSLGDLVTITPCPRTPSSSPPPSLSPVPRQPPSASSSPEPEAQPPQSLLLDLANAHTSASPASASASPLATDNDTPSAQPWHTVESQAAAAVRRLDFRSQGSLSLEQTEYLLVLLKYPTSTAPSEAVALTRTESRRFTNSDAVSVVMAVVAAFDPSVVAALHDGIDELEHSGKLYELDDLTAHASPTPPLTSYDYDYEEVWTEVSVNETPLSSANPPQPAAGIQPAREVAVQAALDPPPPQRPPVRRPPSLLYLAEQHARRRKAEAAAAAALREATLRTLQLADTEAALQASARRQAILERELQLSQRILAQTLPPPRPVRPASDSVPPVPEQARRAGLPPIPFTAAGPLVVRDRKRYGPDVRVTHPLWPQAAAEEEAERRRRANNIARRAALIAKVETLVGTRQSAAGQR
ncbi:uncharacterized protein AMSG_00356 [Thecamonas trahens ATCC 50062]|uniref:Cytochrome c domain-containing protein n=1 Tax=Thecamonas trahens ATCC 50062 TaxID=461836 RepID=A0A0L0D8C8_THETB|nr:hypothetical protein AMSG_00356 [Thecamonas trahens ATCC 50062]KNC48579.1 hypothetical protein AMSG_00356 [Thecamonas trahens ATCC 50062]|eukprot:XP_013762635.1 hypothetical protein AMSG_00356 [Thecamonas trahens ATCC 50062]